MKIYTAPMGVALLAACASQAVAAQEGSDVLTNEGILTLASGGVPELVIVNKIHESNTDFDTSPQALVELTRAGVSEGVLINMVQAEPTEELCVDQASSD